MLLQSNARLMLNIRRKRPRNQRLDLRLSFVRTLDFICSNNELQQLSGNDYLLRYDRDSLQARIEDRIAQCSDGVFLTREFADLCAPMRGCIEALDRSFARLPTVANGSRWPVEATEYLR